MTILVTGCAGFIGFWLTETLLKQNIPVVGVDNLNDYYDIRLKEDRLNLLKVHPRFNFFQYDISDSNQMKALFENHVFDRVVNLAAQAGVRYSLTHPHAYIESNLVGFTNILEGCRHQKVSHLIYASSSSVYGANTRLPFSEQDNVDHPLSLYAATKKANELMAHTYAHLYQLPSTGLRFFTVYGPWGRPDMALFKFVKAMIEEQPIDLYNQGDMIRDFTYVEDIVAGLIRVIEKPPIADPSWSGEHPNPSTSYAPYRIYNIGNSQPVMLMDFVNAIEKALDKKALIHPMPMQPGDVPATHADVGTLKRDFNYHPNTSIEHGVNQFVDWYKNYYT